VPVWGAASRFLTGPQKSQADATAKRLYKLAEALVSLCRFCFHLFLRKVPGKIDRENESWAKKSLGVMKSKTFFNNKKRVFR
jgi:hypothetical protein